MTWRGRRRRRTAWGQNPKGTITARDRIPFGSPLNSTRFTIHVRSSPSAAPNNASTCMSLSSPLGTTLITYAFFRTFRGAVLPLVVVVC